MMTEQIHGLSLRDCARINSKHTELRAQYGERDLKPHLHAFLSEVGTNEGAWAQAWNGWWARMESDPTGQLHAKFATMQQELVLQAHMGDVPDASQDEKAGVSLDSYARIMARIAGGEDAEAVLAEHGVPMPQWQEAQAGWNSAMADDIKITTQYGMLYAKHTPGFQQQMEAQVAATMAEDYARRAEGEDDTDEVEYTLADFVAELDDSKPNTRWTAAHHVCNEWDIGERDDPVLHAAARRAIELASECLLRHDEFTVSNAETLARDLSMFASEGFLSESEASDAKGAIARCLGSGKEHLATLEAAFAPIRDKRVPERVTMQSAIQDYTELVETLTELEEEWDDNVSFPSEDSEPAAAAASPARSGGSAPAAAAAVPATTPDNPLLVVLRGLPVIGPILRALGL